MGKYPPYDSEIQCQNCEYTWKTQTTFKRATCPECNSKTVIPENALALYLKKNREYDFEFDEEKWIQENSSENTDIEKAKEIADIISD